MFDLPATLTGGLTFRLTGAESQSRRCDILWTERAAHDKSRWVSPWALSVHNLLSMLSPYSAHVRDIYAHLHFCPSDPCGSAYTTALSAVSVLSKFK